MKRRPISEQFAITFVKCPTCGAWTDEPCKGKFRQPLAWGIHVARKLAGRKLRREDKALYSTFKSTPKAES